MAEAVLSGVNTFSAQDYTESFFASVPSDERFISSSYQKFPPESSIDGKTIVFVLSRYQASNIYLIQVIFIFSNIRTTLEPVHILAIV